MAQQRQEAVAEVLRERLDPAGAPVVAMDLPELRDAAESLAGIAVRVVGRQAARQGIALGHLEMGLDFVVQFAVESAGSDERPQAREAVANRQDWTSRNRATSAADLAQFATSASSCFAPAFVRA